MKPALLVWCQHSVGVGHLTRAHALCAALLERFRVVLVCGGALPDGIAPPAGVEVVALPALGVGPAGRFVSHDARLTVGDAWTIRRRRLLAAYDSTRPRVVLVELWPFGRARFGRELLPLLERARRDGVPAFSSVRDILVSRRDDQREHDARACALANAHLDGVLVHSDPRFARLEHTFDPHARLRVPVHHTGFVVVPRALGHSARRRDQRAGPAGAGCRGLPEPRGGVVVSVGGGLVGAPLLRTALAAQRILWPRTARPMRLICGPFLPAADRRALADAAATAPGATLVPTVAELRPELDRAAASVSQCGYNTALELLQARVPALVVPYATPEEDEQRRRARRLARLGAVRVLDPERLTPEALAHAILALEGFAPARPALDLDGARRTTELLSRTEARVA
jgi:predicted glycosyltransferase